MWSKFCERLDGTKEDIERLYGGVTVQKWIPVSKRLPEHDGRHLVYRETLFSHVTDVANFVKKKNAWYVHDGRYGSIKLSYVTHWMPLPEPPKEATP